MRVAWLVIADEEIREKIVLAKQGADLHSGTFAQYVFHQYVSDAGAFDAHVRKIAKTYARRCGVMAEALAEFMPEGVRFTRPSGGMFLWVTVPEVDTTELLRICAESKVVFVPGVSFYPGRDVHDGMRLNFSNASEKNIRLGVERLGRAIKALQGALERGGRVAAGLVVGIFPETDPAALEDALRRSRSTSARLRFFSANALWQTNLAQLDFVTSSSTRMRIHFRTT